MRVINLNSEGLKRHAQMLQDQCGIFRPDLVVGIAHGGVQVAQLVFPQVEHISIACQRPSTRNKQGSTARWLLQHLPYCILDRLRMLEARMLSRKRNTDLVPAIDDAELQSLRGASSILLVDDAVDSGSTLRACLQLIAAEAPQAECRSAAITVTTQEPCVRPDYCIYNDSTLIRFPWSIDAKR